VGVKSAHLGFLTEIVEFFENTLPELVNNFIGLVGAIVIIGVMDLTLLFGCLVVLIIVLIVYGLSSKRTMELNRGYNQELEQQVSVLSDYQPVLLRRHLQKLMRWNIRLSDLETINFSVVWLFMMVFLVTGIVFSIEHGMNHHGTIFSLVLYLFQFIEAAVIMPVFYQQGLRLREIIRRLNTI
jgi:ABC-type transport system involved in cytochrome bd biosynthesis fused ATPase/permease subunit